jgi:CHAD domain-containing protein
MVVDQYEELLRNDPLVRMTDDADAVHDMRVAVRRLRALLRAGRSLVATDTRDLDTRLKELGRALGDVRDLDVLLARLRGEAVELGDHDAKQAEALLAALSGERADKRRLLLETLRSDAYLTLLDDTATTIQTLQPSRAGMSLDDVSTKASAKLRKAVRTLPKEPSDEELHGVRKAGKRARYAAELAERKKVVKRAKALQDVLGEHQDAVVAVDRLRELAQNAPPQQAVAAGRLIEREQMRQTTSRAAWPKAWKRLRKAL